MQQSNHSHTKIVATIGPACNSKETLRQMILEGIDVCRLNFSHGSHDDHKKVIKIIRQLNQELDTNVALLADLQGPKLRVGDMENGVAFLENGKILRLVTNKCLGTSERVYISYKSLPQEVKIGETILLDDGKIKLQVEETNEKDEIITRIISGGNLSGRKGVNLPNTNISLPSLTPKDILDANFALENDIDWIALSFVRKAVDVVELKDLIKKSKVKANVIAKIEKPEALDEINNIVDISDGIMIARGDLGVETPFDKVPLVQKQIVSKCIENGKPVIIATQMMESMIDNFRPTRAEATDVANAVLEGADALMLSGETSIGKYPVDVIRNMQQVIFSTESKGFETAYDFKPDPGTPSYLPAVISYNACKLSDLTKAKGIVIFTYSGGSVFQLTKNRPEANIFAFTPDRKAMKQLSLLRGVRSFHLKPEPSINDAIELSSEILKSKGLVAVSDVLVYVGGIPMRERGPINMMKIAIVK